MYVLGNVMNKKSCLFSLSVFFILVISTLVHNYFWQFDLVYAMRGWSSIDFANTILHHSNFANDFPGGGGSTKYSIYSWVSPLLISAGLPEKVWINLAPFFEMSFLCFAVSHLYQTIFKEKNYFAIIFLILLFLFSFIRHSTLGRIDGAGFLGLFYGYADALSFLALSFFFRKQYRTSSVILMFEFMIHPIKTLSAICFLFASFFSKTDKKSKQMFYAYLTLFLFCIIWYKFWYLSESIEKMSAKDFFRYSPIFNSHWFPQDLRLFTLRAGEYGLPFFSSIGVVSAVLLRTQIDIGLEKVKSLFFGILVLTILTLLGCLFAWFELSPFVIKLCLQRFSVLILGVGAIICSGALFMDLRNRNIPFIVLMSLILLTAFFTNKTWPPFFFILYSVLTIKTVYHKKSRYDINLALLCIYTAMYSIYFLYVVLLHFYPIKILVLHAVLFGGSIVFVNFLTSAKSQFFYMVKLLSYRILLSLLILCSSIGSISYSINYHLNGTRYLTKGKYYKDAQLWAKNNTSISSLFLTPPNYAYGWRDFSRRSSFGTMQEWLKTAWLYNNDNHIFQLGLSRALMFTNDIMPSLRDQEHNPLREGGKLVNLAVMTFYNPDIDKLKEIVKKNNIAYIVFDKHDAKKYGAIPSWKNAYSNRYYVILKAPVS